jgi:non-specific serine/threonine protein kinase
MICGLLYGLGGLARIEGAYEQSRALLEETLALARKIGDQWMAGVILFSLGSLARAERDSGRAETFLRGSLAVFRDLDNVADAPVVVAFFGVLAIERGAHERGARLLGAVDPRFLRRQWLFRDERRAYEDGLTAARAALGEREFVAAWAEGQAMTLDQAVAYALSGDADA